MLRGQEGKVWKGTFDMNYEHHRKVDTLMQSAARDCNICRVLCEELAVAVGLEAWDGSDDTANWVKKLSDRLVQDYSELEDTKQVVSSALLTVMRDSNVNWDDESKAVPSKSISTHSESWYSHTVLSYSLSKQSYRLSLFPYQFSVCKCIWVG